MQLADVLPTLNAVLNGLSALLLAAGFVAIRKGRRELHRRLMLAAVGSSGLFLVSYLTRVMLTGTHRFPGSGWLKTVYLSILGSHTLLAAAAFPLILITLYYALLRGRFDLHKRVARVTLPIWAYVSVTGVAIYVLLYHVAPKI